MRLITLMALLVAVPPVMGNCTFSLKEPHTGAPLVCKAGDEDLASLCKLKSHDKNTFFCQKGQDGEFVAINVSTDDILSAIKEKCPEACKAVNNS